MNRAAVAVTAHDAARATPPLRPATLEAMAGAVHAALFNETTGWYWRLDPAEQAKIGGVDARGAWRWATVIDVVATPSAQDLALVGVTPDPETGRRDRLLGLFTGELDAAGELVEDPNAPPAITLYAGEILAAGYDPVDVAIHELGHRFTYNDEHINPPQEVHAVAVRSLQAEDSACPVCAVDDWLSMSERALFALRERSHMQHRIPLGLGGRIPETRAKLERAQAALDRAEQLPEIGVRQGEVRQLRGLIAAAQDALEGDHLGPQDISRAHGFAFRAWDANVDLGHAYYLGLLHPA